MYIDPHKINLQDAAGMQLVELIRNLGDIIEAMPYDETPAMAGAGSAGESVEYARGDHQHPSDTSKLDVSDGERIENEALNAYPVNNAQGAVVSFDDGSGLKANEVIIGIVPVQSGSGTPAPDNVRTISGWTGANVTKTGKNIIDANTVWADWLQSDGTFYEPLATAKYYIPSALVGKQMTISAFAKADANNANLRVAAVVGGETKNGNLINNTTVFEQTKLTFTPTSTDDYVVLQNSGINGTYKDIQLELGADATTYEAYRGTTIPISFGTEAGTVYGGSLNVTTGVLTVTHTINTLDGTQHLEPNGTLTYGGIQVRYEPSPTKANGGEDANSDLKSNRFKTGTTSSEGEITGRNASGNVVLNMPEDVTTVEAAATWFENNNTQIWYKLATPVAYELTPVEVELLVGYNALWCDTGDVSVEYKADTTAFVNNAVNSLANVLEKIITANIETEMKATKNYLANDLIIANGNLYKASSNIASGATLTVDTNVTATTIAAELASISVGG